MMLAGLAMLAAVATAGPPHAPAPADRVTLIDRSIRLADVLPFAKGALGRQIIASVPLGRQEIVLSRVAIGSLVRRAVPGMTIAGLRDGRTTFVVRSRATTSRPGGCTALAASVSSGVLIDSAMIVPATCSKAPPARLSFDRALALPRATTALAAGAYLGRLRAHGDDGMHVGEPLQMVSAIGPVRIVRDVTAMQASRGRRVFVRDADGQVFSVRRAELAR